MQKTVCSKQRQSTNNAIWKVAEVSGEKNQILMILYTSQNQYPGATFHTEFVHAKLINFCICDFLII